MRQADWAGEVAQKADRVNVNGALLTPRELDVLRLVVKGMSNRDAGGQLGIAHGTVAKHVGSIMGKLRATSRTQAATEAVRRGIVDLWD